MWVSQADCLRRSHTERMLYGPSTIIPSRGESFQCIRGKMSVEFSKIKSIIKIKSKIKIKSMFRALGSDIHIKYLIFRARDPMLGPVEAERALGGSHHPCSLSPVVRFCLVLFRL